MTESIEAAMLSAIIEDDEAEAARLASTLLMGEARALSDQADILSRIAYKRAIGHIQATGDAAMLESGGSEK